VIRDSRIANIDFWCNGSTAVFGTASPSSNLGRSAVYEAKVVEASVCGTEDREFEFPHTPQYASVVESRHAGLRNQCSRECAGSNLSEVQ
jgi:hypothetical protein